MPKVALAFILALLVGCAANRGDQRSSAMTTTGFDLPLGELTLVFGDDGSLISARATSIAQVLSDTAAGKESAVAVATIRARRSLAEFLQSRVTSEQSVRQIAKASSQGDAFAQRVSDRITTQASALLKGCYVSKVELLGGSARVELSVGRESIDAASQLQRLMGSR